MPSIQAVPEGGSDGARAHCRYSRREQTPISHPGVDRRLAQARGLRRAAPDNIFVRIVHECNTALSANVLAAIAKCRVFDFLCDQARTPTACVRALPGHHAQGTLRRSRRACGMPLLALTDVPGSSPLPGQIGYGIHEIAARPQPAPQRIGQWNAYSIDETADQPPDQPSINPS